MDPRPTDPAPGSRPWRTVGHAVLGLLISASLQAQEGGAGILYGRGHAYSLTAPKGWVLDNSSGVDQGLHAVFYREGESWSTGTAVMYTNVAPLDSAAAETGMQAMANDIRSMKEGSPQLQVEPQDTIVTTQQHRKAVVQHFDFGKDGNQESVAYISERTVLVMVVLTARDKRSYKKALKAFRDLVESYSWLTDRVEYGH